MEYFSHKSKEENNMRKWIIWYTFEGEENFTIITAEDEDEARRKFYSWHSNNIIDIHEVPDDERYLEFC